MTSSGSANRVDCRLISNQIVLATNNAPIFSAIVVVVAAGNSLIAAFRHVVTNILIADCGSRAVDRRCVDASVVYASVGSAGISVTGKTNGPWRQSHTQT